MSISCCRTSFSPPTFSSPTPLGVWRSTPQSEGGVNPLRACTKSLHDKHTPENYRAQTNDVIINNMGFYYEFYHFRSVVSNQSLWYPGHCVLFVQCWHEQPALTVILGLGACTPPSPWPQLPSLKSVRSPPIRCFF